MNFLYKVNQHNTILKCNNCGKEYTFQEFLDIFDQDHNLAIPLKDYWNDENEIQEFYDGWAIWANYLKLKCIQCEESNWEDIILKNENESKKDEL